LQTLINLYTMENNTYHDPDGPQEEWLTDGLALSVMIVLGVGAFTAMGVTIWGIWALCQVLGSR
jgi:hypothetical protein